MAKNLGLDLGYGYTKYSYRDDSGQVVFGKFQTVVANTRANSTDLITTGGRSYYVGDHAMLQPTQDIIDIVSYQELQIYAPILLKEIERVTDETYTNVMAGLSLAQSSQVENFRSALASFEIGGVQQNYNVAMTAQGIGAAEVIRQMIASDKNLENKHIVIIDFGTYTLDLVIVVNGVIRAERLAGYEGLGVVKTAYAMQKYITDTFGKDVSVKEALKINDDKSYKLRGVSHDLRETVQSICTNYTEDTMKFLESKVANDFDKADHVFCVGGGAYLIDPAYSANMIIPENAEYFNAYGNLLLLEETQK